MSYRPETVEHLIAAANYTLARQERLAHAEFYHGSLSPESRAFVDDASSRPWRGLMSPDMLSIINILEEMGRYDAPDLVAQGRAA